MQAENLVGKEIDNIIIQERLRGRGLSVLYRGFVPRQNKNVMLRVLRLHPDDSTANMKFRYEIERLRMLQHPNILPLRGSGISGEYGYVTYDFFRGGALDDLLADAYMQDITETTRILIGIAGALGHAHARGVVHYDLHPAAVLLDDNQHPFLTDFGLAERLLGDDVVSSREGQVRLPSYTAPEHLQGHELDVRANIYSLGAIFYHLTTGRPPHRTDGSVTTVIERHIHETPIPPRRVNRVLPASLEKIIMRALDKTPAKRHASTNAFISDLERAMRNLYEGLDIPEVRTADLEAITIEDNPRREVIAGTTGQRRRGTIVVVGTMLFVVVALVYISMTFPPPDEPTGDTPVTLTAPEADDNGR